MSFPAYGSQSGDPQGAGAPQGGYPPAYGSGYPAAVESGYVAGQSSGYQQAQNVGYPPAQGFAAATTEGYQGRSQQQPVSSQQPPQTGGYPQATPQPGGYPQATPQPGGYPQATPQPGGYPQATPQIGGYPHATSQTGGYPQATQPPAGNYPATAGQGSPEESIPSAPPLEKMDEISGYSGNNFDRDAYIPPPSYEEATRPPERSTDQTLRVPVIDETTARKALLNEVDQHCCWGKGPADNLQFLDLQSTSALHYTLETFTEGRTTKWAYEPYLGQQIDSPAYGPAPMAWDVQVPAPTMFVSKVHKTEIPHTASIKPCHTCFGMGRKRCISCKGNGWDRCNFCNGTGKKHNHHHNNHNNHHHHGHHHHGHHGHHQNDCSSCQGRGRRNCGHCHGQGSIQCHTCQGRAQLKCFIKLTVTWNNRFEDFVADKTKLPIERLRKVNGEISFQEEYPRVYPLTHYPDPKVNNASVEIITKHSTAFPSERILMQRHKVRVIPITEVIYKHKSQQGNYLVYGFENQVYIEDYPSTCCGCCCVIL